MAARCANSTSRRRLQRNDSSETQPVLLEKSSCIRGAVLQAWMIVALHEVGEAECMALLMKSLCLNWLLEGIRDAKKHRGAVANLVRECAHMFAGTCCASDSLNVSHSHGVINVACSEACDRTRGRCENLDSDHDTQFRTTDVVTRPGRETTRCSGS